MSTYLINGQKWGYPTGYTEGGQVTWSFATTVGDLIGFDYQITESDFRDLIRDAFAAWETYLDIDFIEVSDSSSVGIRLGWDAIDGQSGTLGEAIYSYQYTTSEYDSLTQAEIRFDWEESWTSDKDYTGGVYENFYAVALHEIGHAIGLGHSTDPNTLMYAYLSTQTDLTASDILGGQIIYGGAYGAPLLGDYTSNTLRGTDYADYMIAGDGADFVYGYAGNDRIYAGAEDIGNDYISAGDGNDIAGGGSGNDDIYGGNGRDLLFGGAGADDLFGESGNDTLWAGLGVDLARGGNDNDVMGGGSDGDYLYGESGDDVIYASSGGDYVSGGGGKDTLFGGDGNDTIAGGTGDDTMYGGFGNNVFVIDADSGDDAIGGFFSLGSNRIDLSALSLNGMTDLTISQAGADVVIEFGSSSIRLFNANEADLDSTDFIF